MKTPAQTNQQVADLLGVDTILAAVIMGYDTEEALEQLYPAHTIQLSLTKGYTYRYGTRILPTTTEHKQLRHLIRQRTLRKVNRHGMG